MKKRQTVARRYAEAFFALALEQGLLEQVANDLELLRKTLEENRDLTFWWRTRGSLLTGNTR